MYLSATEMRYELNSIDKAQKGWHISLPVPAKVRPNDKLFKLVKTAIDVS